MRGCVSRCVLFVKPSLSTCLSVHYQLDTSIRMYDMVDAIGHTLKVCEPVIFRTQVLTPTTAIAEERPRSFRRG